MSSRHRKIPRSVAEAALVCAGVSMAPSSYAVTSLTATASVCAYSGAGQGSTQCFNKNNSSETGEAGAESLMPGSSANRASVVQGYGVFHGSAQVVIDGASAFNTAGFNTTSGATGIAVDTLTIGGGVGRANLQLTFTIDGLTAVSGSGPNYGSDAWLTTEVDSFAHRDGGGTETGKAVSGQIFGSRVVTLTGALPFFFDRPLDLKFITNVYAATGISAGYFGSTYSGRALANFGNTAVLTSMQAYDMNGNLIPNITISAASGTMYPLAAEPVPEPGTLSLMGLGIAALLYRRRQERAPGRRIWAFEGMRRSASQVRQHRRLTKATCRQPGRTTAAPSTPVIASAELPGDGAAGELRRGRTASVSL